MEQQSVEIYRDEREDVWHTITPKTIEILYQKYIRPSLFFQEVTPAYFAIEKLLPTEIFDKGLVNVVKKTYISLFRKEFMYIPLGKNFPNTFNTGESPTLLGHLFKNFHQTFIITCHQCLVIFSVSRYACPLDNLYRSINQRQTSGSDYNSIGYCSVIKEYYCGKCQPIRDCRSCKRTVGKNKFFFGSRKCADCFHRPFPPIQRCTKNHSQSEIYTRVSHCSLCTDWVCNFHAVHLEKEDKTICIDCVKYGYEMGIIYGDKKAIDEYLLLTKNEIRITPITLDDKVCINDLFEYIEAYKKLPQRPLRVERGRIPLGRPMIFNL